MSDIKRQHAWRLAAILLLLLPLALVSLGYLLLSTSSGTRFIARSLSHLLGVRVELAAIEMDLGLRLEVRLLDIRVFIDEQAAGEPILTAPRTRGVQTWPAVLAGQLLPLEWTLEAPLLRIPPQQTPEGGKKLEFPPLDVNFVNGTLYWYRVDAAPYRIENLELHAGRSTLPRTLRGSVKGDLFIEQVQLVQFEGSFTGWLADMEFKGRLQELDLAHLGIESLPGMAGKLHGDVQLRRRGNQLGGSVDVDVESFALTLPDSGKRLAPAEFQLKASGSWQPEKFVFEPDRLRLDDLEISGELTLSGTGDARQLKALLSLAPFQVGQPGDRLQLLRLMGMRHQTWANLDRRSEGGWIEDFRLKLELPLAALGDTLAFKRKSKAEELELWASIRDGVYRHRPESAPLEGISAKIHLAGNVLRAQQVELFRHGRELPEIDLEIDGVQRLAQLPGEERRTPKGPGIPIPGLGPAFASFRTRQNEAVTPTIVRLSDFYIGYPAFVLPFRDATATLRFPKGQLVVEAAEGVLGGAPAFVDAVWDRDESQISVQVSYQDGEAAAPTQPAPAWAAGHIEINTANLGGWVIDGIEGELSASGDLVELNRVRAHAGRGKLEADGYVSLKEEGYAPFGFTLKLQGTDAAYVGQRIGLEPDALTGKAQIRGTLAGQLAHDQRFLENADIGLGIQFTKGTLGNLPATLVLARLPSLQGLRGLFGQPLPYNTMSADFTISEGKLQTKNFELVGPELRMLAAGEMNLADEALASDFTVALLMLQTMDRVIDQLPILRDIVLGKDRSLLMVYFRLQGPWHDPKASLLAPRTIKSAAGWPGRVIWNGAKQLRKLLLLGLPESSDGS